MTGGQHFLGFVPEETLHRSGDRLAKTIAIEMIGWLVAAKKSTPPVFSDIKAPLHCRTHFHMIIALQRTKNPVKCLCRIRMIGNFIAHGQDLEKILIVLGKRPVAVTARRNLNEIVAIVLGEQALRRNVIAGRRRGTAVNAACVPGQLHHTLRVPDVFLACPSYPVVPVRPRRVRWRRTERPMNIPARRRCPMGYQGHSIWWTAGPPV